MAVLPYEHGLAVTRDGDDLRPIRRLNAMKRARLIIDGRYGNRALDVENAAVRNRLALELAPRAQCRRRKTHYAVPSW
jgi:hypothetical protein